MNKKLYFILSYFLNLGCIDTHFISDVVAGTCTECDKKCGNCSGSAGNCGSC